MHPLHSCPSVDKFIAVMGNIGSWAGAFFTGSTATIIGGVFVSSMTGFYFLMRALHERQRMRHEAELHVMDMEAYGPASSKECPDCGANNPHDAGRCEECGAELPRD